MWALKETGTSISGYFFGLDPVEDKPLFRGSANLALHFYTKKEALSFAKANGIRWVTPVQIRIRTT